MVVLSSIHYIYIVFILIIIVVMCMKKDVILPCLAGIGVIGFMATGNVISTVQILYRSVLVSAREFIEIVIIISLVNTMSKSLKTAGADELMIGPVRKLMVNRLVAFFVLGVTMLILSWFIWPTPAVAFIGAIVIPAAVKAGLQPVWTAVSINIFGNGIALSSDYFIQGAPSITAKTAGVKDPYSIINASLPLWLVMSLTVVTITFLMLRRDKGVVETKDMDMNAAENVSTSKSGKGARILSVITPLLFLTDVILMYIYKLKGGEATALIGGTAIIITTMASILHFGLKLALGEVTGFIREGAMFGIRVFSPIIIIGAFFFLGSKESASEILRTAAGGFLTEIGEYISGTIPMNRTNIVLVQTAVGALLGVGGSGFSGLPLIGTLAQVFSGSFHISREGLAALGQIVTIWVGGGTIIPWSVVPVAAMCDVQPFEIVKKNVIPVTVGIAATVIAAVFIL